MHRTRLAAWTLVSTTILTAVPFSTAAAQETKSAAELPAAREIIDRFVEVVALDKLLATKSMHITGEVEMVAFGIKGTLKTWKAQPNKYAQHIDLGPGGLMMDGNDGKVGWTSNSMMGDRILDGTELLANRISASYAAWLKPESLFETLETVGKDKFDGVDCYKVKVVAKPLEGMDAEATLEARTSYEFYEVETGLSRGEEATAEGPTGKSKVVTITTDYKEFDGKRIATKTLSKLPGVDVVATVVSVTFDAVEDSAFDLPPGVASLAAEE